MHEITRIGPIESIVGPITLPGVAEQMALVSLSGDNKQLYAIGNEIYNHTKIHPNDNISFVIREPRYLYIDCNGRALIVAYGVIVYFKKYKEATKRCRRA